MKVTYHYVEPKTPEEKKEQERNLSAAYKIIFDAVLEERKLEEKLKDYPKGFAIMDGKTYNCYVCDMHIKNEEIWYDKWGKKCLACQDAVDRNIIPGSICRSHKDWYKNWEFEMYFKIKTPTIKKLIRLNVLKVRIVPKNGFEVILIKDNIDVLPPKNILKDVSFPVEGDKNTITAIPWYEAKDPKKTLGKYKIWPYLKVLQSDTKEKNSL
jgi:hypothetical protein